MSKGLTLLRRHAVAFAALFLLLGSAAYAAAVQVTTRPAPKKIYACVAGDYHTLNLTTATRTCPRGQHKISWNAAGRHGSCGLSARPGVPAP
jgi:opacity protein-like surface antigen